MVDFGNDTIWDTLTKTDFEKLGNVTLEMLEGNIPIYSFTVEGV
jgi:hypothetical protein